MNEKSDLEKFLLPAGGFQYHGVNTDELMADAYTVATLVLDASGSTYGFRDLIEKFVKENVKALRASPRKDNLLYRQVHFGTTISEFHGYKLLENCNESDYDNCHQGMGATVLRDASVNAIQATTHEARRLADQQYTCNGIIIWITDGCDNGSMLPLSEVAKSLNDAITSEELESIMTIMVGVNLGNDHVKQELQKFCDKVGIDQFEDAGNLDNKTLKRILGFVSKSIVSQSQSVGTGGPSQSLTF